MSWRTFGSGCRETILELGESVVETRLSSGDL
jgi:hypothetical protein